MPRHKRGHILVKVLPVDAECRVPGCRQYGKLTKRIDRHNKNVHQMTRTQHEALPECRYSVVKEAAKVKPYMKYRRPEKCFAHGCRKYGQHFASLTKHLRSVHNLTRDQYNEQRLRTKDRQDDEKVKMDLYFSCLNLEGGCPATRDERFSSDRASIKIRDLASRCFPKLVYCRIYTESCKASIISDEVRSFILPEDEPHCVTYHVKKLLVSASHQAWFKESVEESTATVTRGREPKELQYFCGICPFQHTLQLVATPSLLPAS